MNADLPSLPSQRMALLDFLRCTAIAFVVITHYFSSYLPGGSVGVSVFFCLSGFLITKNLLLEKVTITDFIFRRCFRIYPAYFVICLLHVPILCFLGAGYRDYLKALPFLLTLTRMPEKWLGFGVAIFWTLQVEIWFYLLMPFLIKKLSVSRRNSAIKLLIAIALIYKALVFFDLVTLSATAPLRLLYWMDNLLYGAVAAILLNKPESRKRVLSLPAVDLLMLLTFLLILAIALFAPSYGKPWPAESTIVSFLTAIIIYLSQRYHRPAFRFPKPVTTGSLFAYTIYLCHPFLLEYYIPFRHYFPVNNLCYKLIIVSCLTLLIVVLHYAVETPGIELGKRIRNAITR